MTETDLKTPPEKARASLWMRLLLIASLAVNLLVAGVVIGAIASQRGDEDRGDRLRGARDLAPPPFVLAIKRDDRRAVLRSLRDTVDADGRDRAAVRADLRVILGALRADSFEPEAVRALLAAERGRSQTRQETGEDIFVGYLEGLSAEERRAYADRLERILRRIGQR